MNRLLYLSALAILFLANLSMAEEGEFKGFTVGAGTSVTQGLGVDIGYKLTQKSRFRLELYAWNYQRTETVKDIRYKANLEVIHPGVYFDYRPYSNTQDGLRLTAGVIFNNNDWTAAATPINNTFIINQTVFNASDVGNLKGRVEFPILAPYLGLGYDWKLNKSWSLTTDLGVAYQGKPSVSLSAGGALATNPAFQISLRKEERNIFDDIEKSKIWPVFKVTLEYRY